MSERFNLTSFTDDLINDLHLLRNGKISVRDAHARAELARQVLRAVHYVVIAQRYLVDRALPIEDKREDDPVSPPPSRRKK